MPEKETMNLGQTSSEPVMEAKKSTALSMFATILAITGLGFAIWFNFSDQGQDIIRQFNSGKSSEEPYEKDI